MKTLKITFAALSLLVLTVSGTSIDSKTTTDVSNVEKTNFDYDLVAHEMKGRSVLKQG